MDSARKIRTSQSSLCYLYRWPAGLAVLARTGKTITGRPPRTTCSHHIGHISSHHRWFCWCRNTSIKQIRLESRCL